MRIQLIILLLLFSSLSHSASEAAMKDLFEKYDQIMDGKKTELVDEVFSQKFLKESGGKEEFISKVKGLKEEPSKTQVTWRKGTKGEMYFAKMKPDEKAKKSETGPEFIIVKENGKLKIDGTIENED